MKNRIALISSQSFGKSITKYVEVANAAELITELNNANAKRIILFWRDRFGDGHTEGQEFAPAALNDAHFQWLLTAKDGMRGLFYDRRA